MRQSTAGRPVEISSVKNLAEKVSLQAKGPISNAARF
jgi:hypothetical protein